jgi:hypothetical protein
VSEYIFYILTVSENDVAIGHSAEGRAGLTDERGGRVHVTRKLKVCKRSRGRARQPGQLYVYIAIVDTGFTIHLPGGPRPLPWWWIRGESQTVLQSKCPATRPSMFIRVNLGERVRYTGGWAHRITEINTRYVRTVALFLSAG